MPSLSQGKMTSRIRTIESKRPYLSSFFFVMAHLKSYTNRFGLQVSRTIVGCSWCKTAYHLKCFTEDELKAECHFGDHSQLMVPPSWIVKSSNKNVKFTFYSTFCMYATLYPFFLWKTGEKLGKFVINTALKQEKFGKKKNTEFTKTTLKLVLNKILSFQ